MDIGEKKAPMITLLVGLAVWIALVSFFVSLGAMAKYGERHTTMWDR